MRIALGDGGRKTRTKLALREDTRPTQRSQQQSPGHAWNLLHSFGVHSHLLIYITLAPRVQEQRCG